MADTDEPTAPKTDRQPRATRAGQPKAEQITLDGVSADELTAVARIVNRLNSGELTKTRSSKDEVGAVLASIDLEAQLTRDDRLLGVIGKRGGEYRFVPATP